MNRTWIVGALLALLGVGVWFVVDGMGDAPAESSNSVVPQAVQPGVVPQRASVAEPAILAAEPEPEAPRAAQPTTDDMRTSAARDETVETVRVAGRVSLPIGAPREPDLAVVAKGRAGRERFEISAKVGDGGRFALALPADAKRAHLELAARYLHLAEPHKVELAEAPEDIVLEALVGGRLILRLVRKPGVESPSFEGAHVAIYSFDGSIISRSTQADARGVATLEAVPSERMFDHNVTAAGYTPNHGGSSYSVPAGGDREIEVALEREIRLSGRVVNEDGEPIAQAQISAWTSRPGFSASSDQAVTGETGAFDLKGIENGKISLEVDHTEYLSLTHEVGELVPGDVREGIEVVLRSGGRLAGRVVWPDGVPAADVWVRAEGPGVTGQFYDGSSIPRVRSDAEGNFELSGLTGGPFTLIAEERPRRDVQDRLVAGGHLEKSGLRRPQLQARVADVPLGSPGVELALAVGHTLRGRVLDDAGRPFARVRMLVQRIHDGPENVITRTVNDATGAFEVPDLAPGTYELRASAGAGASEPVRVEVPLSGAGPVLVVPRGGRLAGRVLAAGGPVADAVVTLSRSRTFTWTSIERHLEDHRERTTKSDADGRFEFDPVGEGAFVMTADKAGVGTSRRHELVMGAREVRADVAIELELPGSIEGRLAVDLAPLSGREVVVQANAGSYYESVLTDAQGQFRVAGLTPGLYMVRLNADVSGHWTSLASTAVEVLAGGPTSVVLTGSARPVLIRGRLLVGGRPAAARSVEIAAGEGHWQTERATTDADGRFTVQVPQPGSVRFAFDSAGIAVHETRLVPEQEAFDVLFDLPAGAISGVVVGRGGEPAAGVRVTLVNTNASLDRIPRSGRVDAEGRFTFSNVAAGSYRVATGTQIGYSQRRTTEENDPDAVYGTASSEPFDVRDGQHRDDLRVLVPAGGSIRGRVVGAGADKERPVWVQVVPAEGNSVGFFMQVEEGTYHLRGLGPGTYTVMTRLHGASDALSQNVTLREGEHLEVDFD